MKQQIVTLISRNGRPVHLQSILNAVKLPKHVILNDLLAELVAEKRLSRSYTLLVNGQPESTFDLIT
jgi:hypothetical protein